MANFTLQILEEILERRDFDALKGHFENQWFECKRQLYDFNQQRQKAEFAKDVELVSNVVEMIFIVFLVLTSFP